MSPKSSNVNKPQLCGHSSKKLKDFDSSLSKDKRADGKQGGDKGGLPKGLDRGSRYQPLVGDGPGSGSDVDDISDKLSRLQALHDSTPAGVSVSHHLFSASDSGASQFVGPSTSTAIPKPATSKPTQPRNKAADVRSTAEPKGPLFRPNSFFPAKQVSGPPENSMNFDADQQSLMERTLVLQFFGDVRPVERPAIVQIIKDAGVAVTDILACGPVNEGRAWHVVFRTDVARDLLLVKDHVSFRGGQIKFLSLTSKVTKVRVHWVPLHFSHKPIVEMLSQYGRVSKWGWEFSVSKGTENVCTLVRTYVLELANNVSTEDLPFQERLLFGDIFTNILVTVPGRKPRCFRCKQSGHIRPECTTP